MFERNLFSIFNDRVQSGTYEGRRELLLIIYISLSFVTVNQLQLNGENMEHNYITEKVLQYSTPKYEHMVVPIQNDATSKAAKYELESKLTLGERRIEW